MRHGSIGLGLVTLAAAVMLVGMVRLPVAAGSAATTCTSESAPDCGGAAGDAFCGDPTMDCFDTGGNGCQCRPRVCCTCQNVGSSTGCDTLGCTQTGITVLACLALCAANEIQGNDCNLKVLYQQQCSNGSCATSGCCQVGSSAAHSPQTGISACVETDQTTCDLAEGTFVTSGSCSGGLDGTCASPTPTETPTNTPTSTPTQTPTNTPKKPDGAGCTTPSDCTSDFCVDGVCCDTACDLPGQICNDPAEPGTCSGTAAPAPALSPLGLLAALGALAVVAALALMLRTRHL
jgi:hypothetical protein